MEIPKWFDMDGPRPCPCGRPPSGIMVVVEVEDGAKVAMHEPCLRRAMEMGFRPEDE